MENCKRLGAGLRPFLVAIALTLAAFVTEAKAVPVTLGSLSSGSGTVNLNSGFLNFVANSTDTYSFTLTGDATVSGNLSFHSALPLAAFSLLTMDLNSGSINLTHADATGAYIALAPPFGMVPASPGLFSLNLRRAITCSC